MPKPQKTANELKTLIRKRWGAPIGDLTIVPGRDGYWNALPLRTKPEEAPESRARFEAIISELRAEFHLKERS